jgi:hypothetical protein
MASSFEKSVKGGTKQKVRLHDTAQDIQQAVSLEGRFDLGELAGGNSRERTSATNPLAAL